MKKSISVFLFIFLGVFFVNSSTIAQSNTEFGSKIKAQLHKFLNLDGDGQSDCNEAIKVRNRDRLKVGSGECIGFTDENEDGICDNCGGTGECDRDRLNDGNGLKRRGGN
jgi:hypothetical protein